MDYLIYILVGVIAVAVILEAVKRSKSTGTAQNDSSSDSLDDEGPYISADEADPTQTGRMRAMEIKRSIQGVPDKSAAATAAPTTLKQAPQQRAAGGAHTSINHEKVDANESGGFELPDPFSIEISDDSKE